MSNRANKALNLARFLGGIAVLPMLACSELEAPVEQGGCPITEACSPTPVAVSGHQFTALESGQFHTCGLKANGEAWCWGLNTAGQLGAPTQGLFSATPLRVSGNIVFSSITAGDFHTCGLTATGVPWCWGNNSTSVLGVANTTETCNGVPCSRTPVRAAGSLTFDALDAGATHNCGHDVDGPTHCWGYNLLGEIGTPEYAQGFATPVSVQGGAFAELSAGYQFNCALDANGAASCWGNGQEGQLGTLTIDRCGESTTSPRCSPVPVAVNTSLRFEMVSAGVAFACGIGFDGRAYCWGRNSEGQLGDGGSLPSATPLEVESTASWGALSAGFFHACALRTNGNAFCWGANTYAQLGDGTRVAASSVPVAVQGNRSYTALSAGRTHTCALATDGVAWCWGSNAVGQLGI